MISNTLRNIAIFPVFGTPLIVYLGILTLLSFLLTALIGFMNFKGFVRKIPFRWHPKMAVVSIVLALFHGLLAFSIYFNF
jgi:hypothetical protein